MLVLVVASDTLADDVAQRRPEERAAQGSGRRDVSAFFKRFDMNKDGVLEGREIPAALRRRMKQMDSNKDGKLSLAELKKARGNAGGSRRRPGEVVTGAARSERHADSLKVGDMAPDFTLSDPSGKKQVTLSNFRSKKPVVLIFGSYT